MASRVKVKGKNGRIYVYENVSYWDKSEKKSKSRRRCIGHIDEETGEVVPNRPCKKRGSSSAAAPVKPSEVTCTVEQNGIFKLTEKAAEESGLKECLETVFPYKWEYLLSCAAYLCATGNPLYRMETWSKGNTTWMDSPLSSQRLSELLASISDEERRYFYRKWMKQDTEDRYYALDITSVSSYSELIALTKFGYNRDHEDLPQINLLMVTGESSRLPKYYVVLDGKIKDVNSLQSAIDEIDQVRGMDSGTKPMFCVVMDKGFFSAANLDELYKKKYHFTIGVPFTSKLAKEAVEKYRDVIEDGRYVLSVNDEEVYGVTELQKWNNHRLYVHTYFDSDKYRGELKAFNHKLKVTADQLESGEEPDDKKFAEKYFTVKTTPVRGTKVVWNMEAINKQKKSRTGWFVLVSNTIKDAQQALTVYREKDCVEKSFDDLKNQMDMKRLRVHSAAAMEGRIFVQFLALILSTWIKNKMREANWFRLYTFREVMDEMGTFKVVRMSNRRRPVLPQITKLQTKVSELFDLELY